MRLRMLGRRTKLALLVVGLSFVASIGGFLVYRSTLGYWDRLDAVAASIGTPAGMQQVLTARDGTAFCPFSCEEATLSVMFRTRLPIGAACDSLRVAIAEVAPTRAAATPSSAACDLEADLPMVKSDARLFVEILTPEQFRAFKYKPTWFARLRPPVQGEVIAWMVLKSGID